MKYKIPILVTYSDLPEKTKDYLQERVSEMIKADNPYLSARKVTAKTKFFVERFAEYLFFEVDLD